MRRHGFTPQREVSFRQLESLWEGVRDDRDWKRWSAGMKVAFLLRKGYPNGRDGNVWMMAELCPAQGAQNDGLLLRILWGPSAMPCPRPFLLSTKDPGDWA